MRTQNIDNPKEEIAYFCQHWLINKLSLFDSVLRDGFHLESDINILVECKLEHIFGRNKL